MSYKNYIIFKAINPIRVKLNNIYSKIRNECSHTYPNGKSALKPDQQYECYEVCEICGESKVIGNYYDM